MKEVVLGLLALFILFAGCPQQSQEEGGGNVSGKVVMIIAPTDFRDEELFDTKSTLEAKGLKVFVASTSKSQATGMLGGTITPTLLVSEVNIRDYNAVVFVGGNGVETHALYENDDVVSLAREAQAQGKIVAAICIAPRILASAGVVNGKKVTCFPDDTTISMLEEAGANYTAASVQVDGKLITADGPRSAKEFGKKIAEAISAG